MNKENAAQFLPLVQALADGKTIQFLRNGERWEDHLSPGFDGQSPRMFRIKPEPREWLVTVNEDTQQVFHNHDGDERVPHFKVIRVREILD